MDVCRICGNTKDNVSFNVKEMMYGHGDRFKYFICDHCRCLQIYELPVNIFNYYNEKYYSFKKTNYELNIRRKLTDIKNRLYFFPFAKYLIHLILPFPMMYILSKTKISFKSRILDVGCGNGQLIEILYHTGFKNVFGIDPYIKHDISISEGPTVQKIKMEELNGKYDLIMYNHSFEHIFDQKSEMMHIKRNLTKNGRCLLRIPISSSFAWNHYQTDWVQLDSPRHFYLHSIKSINLIAQRSGFLIEGIIYDSTGFQFWGSEQYRRNIPLYDNHSFFVEPQASIFTKEELVLYEKQAKELNREMNGDQAAFILKVKE